MLVQLRKLMEKQFAIPSSHGDGLLGSLFKKDGAARLGKAQLADSPLGIPLPPPQSRGHILPRLPAASNWALRRTKARPSLPHMGLRYRHSFLGVPHWWWVKNLSSLHVAWGFPCLKLLLSTSSLIGIHIFPSKSFALLNLPKHTHSPGVPLKLFSSGWMGKMDFSPFPMVRRVISIQRNGLSNFPFHSSISDLLNRMKQMVKSSEAPLYKSSPAPHFVMRKLSPVFCVRPLIYPPKDRESPILTSC